MEKHLTISMIISIFCYIVVSIQQQHLDISQYTDSGALFLSAFIFATNVAYYINRYLDGEFTNE